MNEMDQELRTLVQKYGIENIKAKLEEWHQVCHVSEEMQRRMKAEDEIWDNLPKFAPGYCSLGRVADQR
jgi:hypothetical protein